MPEATPLPKGIDLLIENWERSFDNLKKEQNFREVFTPSPNASQINFSSNDYLGLRNEERLAQAGFQAALQSGSGSGASRIVLQTDRQIEALEELFCHHTGYAHSLFLGSGFTANLAFFDALSPLPNETETIDIFVDHLAHASLFYALRNGKLNHTLFRHRDHTHLEKKLAHSTAHIKIIVVESIYSMDGDRACAQTLTQLCQKYNATLFLDESHSFGLQNTPGNIWINAHPELKKYLLGSVQGCGKAVGVSGAFLATNHRALKERIIQKSKVFIYSTGVSPFITGAVTESLKLIFGAEGAERRAKLAANIELFQKKMAESAFAKNVIFEKADMPSQIFPLVVFHNEKAVALSKFLLSHGIVARAIRPPTVPKNTARIRIALHCHHTFADIERLFDLLEQPDLRNS